MARALLLQLVLGISLWICADSKSLTLINSTAYGAGLWGAYPHQKYRSVDLESPLLNVLKWDKQCDHGYTLIAPRTGSVPHPGPMILDHKGNLIWSGARFGSADNLQVQQFRGEKFLTFWAGVDQGHYWPGHLYMLDSTYKVRNVLTPVNIGYADNHEFKILPGGTALLTAHETVAHYKGPSGEIWGPGKIRDSIFQEINLTTGKLIFEWRASKHMDISESYASAPFSGTSERNPFEWFHINSVDKDSLGNYLISSRYLNVVAYIDGADGSVIWRLGGKKSDFKDLSGGAASNFSYQHHAVLHGHHHPLSNADLNDSKVVMISLFDNGAIRHGEYRAKESRAMLIDLDVSQMTAKLVKSYVNPTKQLSLSQGSMDILPGSNNILVGWGTSPAWTEFAPDGTVLCDVHFGAHGFWDYSFVQSYRVYKINESSWLGRPNSKPDIAIADDDSGLETVYASWNGATHVASWRLQGSNYLILGHPHQMKWKTLQELPKDGFEVAFVMEETDDGHHMQLDKRHGGDLNSGPQFIRVQALGRKGKVLATTLVADRHTRLIIDVKDNDSFWNLSDAEITSLLMFCVCISAAYLIYWIINFKPIIKRLSERAYIS